MTQPGSSPSRPSRFVTVVSVGAGVVGALVASVILYLVARGSVNWAALDGWQAAEKMLPGAAIAVGWGLAVAAIVRWILNRRRAKKGAKSEG